MKPTQLHYDNELLLVIGPKMLADLLHDGGVDQLGPGRLVVRLAPERPWVCDPMTGETFRTDVETFSIEMVDRISLSGQNISHPAIIEKPSREPEASGLRITDKIVVQCNMRGDSIRVRRSIDVDGNDFLELMPYGTLEDDPVPPGAHYQGYFNADPNRISGAFAVYLIKTDFPQDEGMDIREFKEYSTDGRSLAALAKCGLLK